MFEEFLNSALDIIITLNFNRVKPLKCSEGHQTMNIVESDR
jgi:hypothetical protein